MGTLSATLTHKSGLAFEIGIRDHHFFTDAKAESGGTNLGPNPKELLVSSICGCSAMDVASLLKKMRVPFDSLVVSGVAETTEGHPSIFAKVHLDFKTTGTEVDAEKLIKSVTMSMTKYCGVSAMISKASPIEFDVYINEQKIHSGRAHFEI
jgi:putative redox protein